MRVAVTGSTGRLGRALVEALEDAPFTGPMGPIAWSRPDLDLDTLTTKRVRALIDRDRPELVIHAAAWTDVDGCAREPDLAARRNGIAAGIVAEACAAAKVDVALVSTNEVFDGERTDGRGYAPLDKVNPINPYGASKLSGEILAEEAAGSRLAIIRTSWLHGPPGNDFPEKIARAALRAKEAGTPLKAVFDEIGTPTWTPGPRRRDRRADRRGRADRRHRRQGRDPPPGQRRRRVARRLGARGAPGDRHRGPRRGRPGQHLAAREPPAAVGRAGADADADR